MRGCAFHRRLRTHRIAEIPSVLDDCAVVAGILSIEVHVKRGTAFTRRCLDDGMRKLVDEVVENLFQYAARQEQRRHCQRQHDQSLRSNHSFDHGMSPVMSA